MATDPTIRTKERFWMKVEQGDDDMCWPWLGGVRFRWVDKRGFATNVTPRRAAWAIAHNDEFAPNWAMIDVSCRNVMCCNPKHIVWVQKRDMTNRRPTSRRGELHGAAILTEEKVRMIRRRYNDRSHPITQAALAEEIGVRQETINQIVNWRTWKHVKDETLEEVHATD